MYTMKQACEMTGLAYETLKFYCNQGLVPNVKRNINNHRIFNEKDIAWINSLHCLKNCGMSISEMQEYVNLCLAGESSIPERKSILDSKKKDLQKQMEVLRESIEYIERKQSFYNDVLAGKTEYFSNLVGTDE